MREPRALISTDQLAAALGQPDLRIYDCVNVPSATLADPAQKAFTTLADAPAAQGRPVEADVRRSPPRTMAMGCVICARGQPQSGHCIHTCAGYVRRNVRVGHHHEIEVALAGLEVANRERAVKVHADEVIVENTSSSRQQLLEHGVDLWVIGQGNRLLGHLPIS
jgi:hypothetical protein